MAHEVVKVYIYDISKGLARSLSSSFLGRHLDGIWHTGIVVFGQEFYFGGDGIHSCNPCGTILGQPDKIEELGVTEIPPDMFMDYLHELSNSTFRIGAYHLLDHNCNTFSNEVAQFLTGKGIPSYIVSLPQEVLSTPMGAMLKPFVDAMSVNPGGGHALFGQPDGATSLATGTTASRPDTHDSASATGGGTAPTAPRAAATSFKPLVFHVENVAEQVGQNGILRKSLSDADIEVLDEVWEFVTQQQVTWSLGRSHLLTLGRLLSSTESSLQFRHTLGELLQEAFTREDVRALVAHDPNQLLAGILAGFYEQDEAVQEFIVKGMCNLSSTDAGVDGLLTPFGVSPSLHKMTLSICVQCVLHNDAALQYVGCALAANITSKKPSQDLALAVGCALIELGQREPPVDSKTDTLLKLALTLCIAANPEVEDFRALMDYRIG